MIDPILLLILRLLHIFLGVFWAGSALFLAFFLGPAVKAVGPDGGKVMGRISMSKWPIAISVSAVLTTLAGFALYFFMWREASDTPSGIGFSIGGLFGIFSLIVGGAIVGPTGAKIARLGQEIQSAGGGPPPADKLAEMGKLQLRLERATTINAILLVIAVILMSISRYLNLLVA
jgi:hypothetical protein